MRRVNGGKEVLIALLMRDGRLRNTLAQFGGAIPSFAIITIPELHVVIPARLERRVPRRANYFTAARRLSRENRGIVLLPAKINNDCGRSSAKIFA